MVYYTGLSAVAVEEIAEFMGALGFYRNSKEIRAHGALVSSIAVSCICLGKFKISVSL